MNRRGFFGHVAGLFGIPFIPEPPMEHPVRDTGEFTITTSDGVTRHYFRCTDEEYPLGEVIEGVGF